MTSVLIWARPNELPKSGSIPENPRTFFEPVWRWKGHLAREGVKITFVKDFSEAELGCHDVVMVAGKAISQAMKEDWRECLSRLKRKTARLVFLDDADSTAIMSCDVFGIVDTYAKRSLLKVPARYLTMNAEVRVHDEYFLNKSGIFPAGRNCLSPDNLRQIRLSWNFVYQADGRSGELRSISRRLGRDLVYPVKLRNSLRRRIPLSALYRVNGSGPSAKVRELFLDLARPGIFTTDQNGVSRKEYYRLLRDSKSSISPFGFGELCIRDFEIGLFGGILLKPSVEHLVSFPSILEIGKSYLGLPWEPEKWLDAISDFDRHIISRKTLEARIVSALTSVGRQQFVTHFITCLVEGQICGDCGKSLEEYVSN